MLSERFAHACSPLGMELCYCQAAGLTFQPVRLSSRSTSVCAPGHKSSPATAAKTQHVSALEARRPTRRGSRVTEQRLRRPEQRVSGHTVCITGG